MEKENEKCGVCELNHRRLAITVNEVKICHGCLEFFSITSRHQSIPVMDEIDIQTRYVKQSRCNSTVAGAHCRDGLVHALH